MVATCNFTLGYAECLVASTPADLLAETDQGKAVRGLSPEDIWWMEHERESPGREFKLNEDRSS